MSAPLESFYDYLTCESCVKKYLEACYGTFDGREKPFADYFHCECSSWRPGKSMVEVERWFDVLCLECALEQGKCRVCETKLPDKDDVNISPTHSEEETRNADGPRQD
jgi:hypothetical protein